MSQNICQCILYISYILYISLFIIPVVAVLHVNHIHVLIYYNNNYDKALGKFHIKKKLAHLCETSTKTFVGAFSFVQMTFLVKELLYLVNGIFLESF